MVGSSTDSGVSASGRGIAHGRADVEHVDAVDRDDVAGLRLVDDDPLQPLEAQHLVDLGGLRRDAA